MRYSDWVDNRENKLNEWNWGDALSAAGSTAKSSIGFGKPKDINVAADTDTLNHNSHYKNLVEPQITKFGDVIRINSLIQQDKSPARNIPENVEIAVKIWAKAKAFGQELPANYANVILHWMDQVYVLGQHGEEPRSLRATLGLSDLSDFSIWWDQAISKGAKGAQWGMNWVTANQEYKTASKLRSSNKTNNVRASLNTIEKSLAGATSDPAVQQALNVIKSALHGV